VAELLEGDYFDMFALLRWADQILLQPTRVLVDNSYVWIPLRTDDDKRSILQTEIYFMRAFRGVEMDHRSEHGIDVGKTLREEVYRTCPMLLSACHECIAKMKFFPQNGAAATYNGVVHERRAGLLRLRPAPVSHVRVDHIPYTGDAGTNTNVYQNACDIELWNNKQRLRLEYGDKNFFNWAHAKLAFVEEILRMVERKDGRLLPSYKRSLPSTTIVYS
jgi:hypothetical protein